ncbi:MAG TPA: 30S ribosomal protein S2 [Capillimicrobium sp.]|nr:30S ribosomal protein S2 [Capillimicrobium sp.]
MAEPIGIRELLEAGVHFGHQTRRWNPKMRRFIYGERDGIYIIDLLKTQALLEQAREFAGRVANRGGVVLFVGTKKQARDAIKETAEAAGMPYVNQRWLGGLLTNFQTISQRIRRLHDLERYEREGQLALLPTRERLSAEADLAKLRANLGGVKHMQRTPDAMFVVDLKTEAIAVKEAQRLRIPIIGLVDTNVDPDGIDYVIPGNDDAIKSCALITKAIGDVVAQGHQVFRAEEERARKEAEEKARKEAEERARREAEEQARREAEQAAQRAAEEQARQEAAAAGGGETQHRQQPDPHVTQEADREKAQTARKAGGPRKAQDPKPAPQAEAGEPITNADVAEAEAEAEAAAAAAPAETPADAPAPEAGAANGGPVAEEPAAPSEPAETPKADDSVGVAQPENENANEESNT